MQNSFQPKFLYCWNSKVLVDIQKAEFDYEFTLVICNYKIEARNHLSYKTFSHKIILFNSTLVRIHNRSKRIIYYSLMRKAWLKTLKHSSNRKPTAWSFIRPMTKIFVGDFGSKNKQKITKIRISTEVVCSLSGTAK